MKKAFRLLALTAALSASLLIQSCGFTGATPVEASASARTSEYQIYFDVTPSVTPGQRQQWAGMVERDVLPALRDGSRIELYGLHDHTEDAAPIFRDSLPALEDGAGMAEDSEYRLKKEDFRNRFLAGVRQLLSEKHAQARSTSVLGAFERVPASHVCDRVMILFTDGLESQDPLNLERRRLDPSQMPAMIQSVAERRRWDGNRLHGGRVYFVLNSLDIGAPTFGATDRHMIRLFWSTLTDALGGTLENWDTHLARLP